MIVEFERLKTDAAYLADMQHRFISDWFFACEFLGRPMHRVLHAPVANLYPKKNPNLSIQDQHHKKKRMLLDPRFSWKTTGARIEKVQWITAFPKDITILTQTATQPLAKKISKVIANNFYCKRYKEPGPLLRLFPELKVDKAPFSGNDSESWNTPQHEDLELEEMDDTLAYTSPQSVQSGWHPWIMNCDDMVEMKNSGPRANPEVRQGIIDLFDTNKNTLVPGGYMYLTGTRYHPFDLYGVRLEDMDPDEWEVVLRCSLERRDKSRLLVGEFPPEDEVILHFPDIPGLDYKSLRSKFNDNYEMFMNQQQNDPQGGHTSTFDDKLYDGCEVDEERVPLWGGEVFTCWRLPYGSHPSTNKFVEGAAARILDGKVYVVDCWRYGGTPSHQAEMMVQQHKLIGGDGMMVLDTPGYEGMMVQIRNEAAKKNISVRLQLSYWEENDNMRVAGIKQMESLLKVGRVLFARGMTKGQECRKQFVHFGLIEETGLVECVQKLADHVPLSQLRANMDEEELEWQRNRRENGMLLDFLAQQGMPQVDEQLKQKAQAHVQAMEKSTTWSMPGLPGGLDG